MAHAHCQRLIAGLTLAIYLMAGAFSVTHAATYGDDAHDHSGNPCIIKHFIEDTGHTMAAATVSTTIAFFDDKQWHIAALATAPTLQAGVYLSRAPPRHQGS